MNKLITYAAVFGIGFSNVIFAEGDAIDCIIEPSISSELSTSVSGVVHEVLVEKGAAVKKGQLLATLKSDVELKNIEIAKIRSEFVAELKSKDANYHLAMNNMKRIDDLYAKKLISADKQESIKVAADIAKFELDSIHENIHLAKIELKRAYSILDLRTIISPLTGFVVETYKTSGEYVVEEPILKVVQINPLYVEVIAPVALFGKVKKGDIAEVSLESPIGGKYEASVIVIDPIIDAGSGTFGIRLALQNPDNLIPVGLSCNVIF